MEEHHKKRSFTKGLSHFASATFISRVLGYVRDALVASFFGGGFQTDAFYAAFKIPNLLRRFLGEGSLTSAFVPVFTDVMNKEGEEEARRFLNALVSGLLVILIVLVTLGIVFAPAITRVVAWGFVLDPEKFKLTADLTRLTFPFLLVVSLAAVATAVLNSRGKFFIAAVAPSGLSIAEIAFIVALASRMESPVHGLAVSAVVGGLIHLVWQLPGMVREGFRIRLVKPFAHPRVRSVFVLMLPTIIGLCADQVNSFVDQFCASFLREGSITALYNSNRVMQMPLAMFGVAVASVSLPAMSKAASDNDDRSFKSQLGFSIRIANFVLIPSLIGLSVLAYPIIQLLFEHGRFTADNTWLTVQALIPAAFGLPAFSMAKIFASAFYAKKDTQTPMRIALWSMVVHVILNYALMWRWGVGGLAFSTSVAAYVQTLCLFFALRRRVGLIGGKEIARSFLFSSLAGVAMGALCWVLAFRVLATAPELFRVLVPIAVGTAFYFYAAKLLGIAEYSFFMDALRRKKIIA